MPLQFGAQGRGIFTIFVTIPCWNHHQTISTCSYVLKIAMNSNQKNIQARLEEQISELNAAMTKIQQNMILS